MKQWLAITLGIVLFAPQISAQVTIDRNDIAARVDVVIEAFSWNAGDNISGSAMPDTAGLGAILEGGEADFRSIVGGLQKEGEFIMFGMPADVPGADSFALATHVEKTTLVGVDSSFYRFVVLDDDEYTWIGSSVLFDIDQNSVPDTLVTRYEPKGWEVRDLPVTTGKSWQSTFTQWTWVTIPGFGSVRSEGTTEDREYEIIGTTTLTTPAGSAEAVIAHIYEFITHEGGMVDIALERYSFITEQGAAVSVAFAIDRKTRNRLSLNSVVYHVPENLSGVRQTTDLNASKVGFQLKGNYPNPFRGTTTITFSLEHSARVRLAIVDLLGRETMVPFEDRLSAGHHSVDVSAADLAEGYYRCRLYVNGNVAEHAMIVRR